MFSGLKFIPRDQIDEGREEDGSKSSKRRKKDGKREKKGKRSSFSKNSSDDDDLEKIKEGSRRKKKWYSSDEYSSPSLSPSASEGDEDRKRRARSKKPDRGSKKEDSSPDGGRESDSINEMEITRKEMGLDWMLRPADSTDKRPAAMVDEQPEEQPAEEVKRANPRELNPYLKDDGSGYPEEAEEKRGGEQLPSSAVVGDGGASWRLKALKRAQEQAAREGRNLDEVVKERWDSLGQLAVSAASHRAAPSRAHLRAIKSRQARQAEDQQPASDGKIERDIDKNHDRSYLKDVSVQREMRAPKIHDSLSWGKRKNQKFSTNDADLISSAASSLNRFANDGSFMNQLLGPNDDLDGSKPNGEVNSKVDSFDSSQPSEGSLLIKEGMTANQLAAKALQLRLKGKHEEADKLMKESEKLKEKQNAGGDMGQHPRTAASTDRYAARQTRRKDDDNADKNLARTIMQNKQYSLSGRADDEYDYPEDGPSKKSRKKEMDKSNRLKPSENNNNLPARRILTQQERCLFCFENTNRPKHLVVSIANFTYLTLPQQKPLVPGHCCILPLQHESATRNVENSVWEEIRNFKKCLIRMFAKQDKEVVFLETVMGLAQQRRHCLVECIPLPQDIAKEAPLYFKKAIDEAEDEWSQHNAKKLIDTSVKGLRGSIPKDFPYFHVEFGLDKGFVHVIDDESQFNSSLGLNVIRGMMELPEEDMYRRRRHETVEGQKLAVADFVRDWEPFDWTKQLH